MLSPTNKTKSRTTIVTQSATPSINVDNTSVAVITGIAQAVTSFTTNLSGTPTNNQVLVIDLTDNGTARAITWGASFENGLSTLPTTTIASTRMRIFFKYSTTSSKWSCMGVE